MQKRAWAKLGFGICALALAGSPAMATFHEWRLSEVFSDASGLVQFIEMQEPGFQIDDERFLNGNSITDSVLSHAFTFPNNLPIAPPANAYYLIGTPAYAALSGAPAPDYTLPINNFFSTAGDTLTFVFGVDTLTFTSAQLPTNGSSSLNRTSWGAATVNSQTASPTNFGGVTGTVPEPGMIVCISGLVIAALMRWR
jgi:hypothetical protein